MLAPLIATFNCVCVQNAYIPQGDMNKTVHMQIEQFHSIIKYAFCFLDFIALFMGLMR